VTARSTTTRDQHRRIIRRGEPPCAICGLPIDYKAHHLDPLSFTVDHTVPLAKGGADTLDNKQPTHRKCNRDKSDKLDVPAAEAWVTARNWWSPGG
jgi:5-methylcytosine-specific restriction endonuclease McrA